MNPIGVYLYGFIPQPGPLDQAEIEGIEAGGPIRVLTLGTSTAVIGEVPLQAYEAALSADHEAGPDPSWVIPRALRHQAILDEVQARSPVLPARFGTLFTSHGSLEGMINQHQDAIARYFQELGDRLEWSIQGYHDPDRAIELLIEIHPDLARRRQGLPESPGTRYFLEKKLREDARRQARQVASKETEVVRSRLRTWSDDVRSLPLRRPESASREMVLHETFLIAPGQATEVFEDLDAALNSVGSRILTLEPSGPWPPFHFCPDLGGEPS